MVAYLWLVWYHASSNSSPKHWALAVTYELHERAYATFYEVSVFPPPEFIVAEFYNPQIMGDGNGMGQFLPSVVRRVHLTGTHGNQTYDGKLLLGEINDSVLGALEMYGESAVEMVNTNNRKRGLGESNCQVRSEAPNMKCTCHGLITEHLSGLGDYHCAKLRGCIALAERHAC